MPVTGATVESFKDLCGDCGNTCADHYDYEGHAITTCRGFMRLARPVVELLEMLVKDREVVDYLEKNTAYIMLGADATVGRMYSRLLENRGRGWDNSELRHAVHAAIDGRQP